MLNSNFATGSARSGTDGLISVTFDSAFNTIPKVFFASQGTSTEIATLIKAISISKTGFTARAIRVSSGMVVPDDAAALNWFAIAK